MKCAKSFLLIVALSAVTAHAQTTTWRAADNPHVVQGTYSVPEGQTLVLEPGVRVEIRADSRLDVRGQLLGNGTAANRITFLGANNYNAELVVRGRSDLKFTDIRMKTVPESNGTLLFADCRFRQWGSVFNGQVLQQPPSRAAYVQFDRCEFIGDDPSFAASLFGAYFNVVLRDTVFRDGSMASVAPGYLYVDRVTSTGSRQSGLDFGSDGDLFLDNLTVTNAAQAGLVLSGDTRNGSNVLLGPNVTLQNNQFPVHLTVAGLHRESTIPSTGNRNNLIHVSGSAGNHGLWPKFAIPYRVDASPLTVGNQLWIEPGVVVKMAPYAYINDIGFGDGMRAFGTKAQPITFERENPSLAWYDLHSDRTQGGRLRHVIIDGSTDGVNGGEWRIENAIFRNNGIGTNGDARVSGSQYLGNGTGHWTSGNLNSPTNPNSFEGNQQFGVRYSDDARNNWWGSPSGPTSPQNRGGTGDRIESELTQFKPFLTARPNYDDAPPEVRMLRPHFQQDPGSKTTLRWESTDDGSIVAHKILFSAVGNFVGNFQTVATLPGTQRTYEWTVPAIGFQVAGADSWIKVVAVDDTGKESFDEWEIVVPTNTVQGSVNYRIAPGQVFEPGEYPAPLADENVERYMTRVESYIEVVGAVNRKMYTNSGVSMPFLSTDTARYVVAFGDTTNRRTYWYSPLFAVRPNPIVGDAAPTVELVSPANGAGFAPGAVVPISWNASDDEGLRGFDIVASFNDGRTWQPIAANLAAGARSFEWQTAPGSGFASVRVMVIA
ncbi:MAG TPA: Ig-like domain-containing protein, partial [Chthoniobacterales bacterium]